MEKITTKDLVQELIKREGVDTLNVEPYSEYKIQPEEGKEIQGTGPAIILTVID